MQKAGKGVGVSLQLRIQQAAGVLPMLADGSFLNRRGSGQIHRAGSSHARDDIGPPKSPGTSCSYHCHLRDGRAEAPRG